MPKIKNIIIFIAIAGVFVLIYVFFFKSSSETPGLVSSNASTLNTTPVVSNSNNDTMVAQDFLSLLLSVKSIKLDDSIFANPAFMSLHDSSIVLTPDGTEGRNNPFAPFNAGTNASATTNTTTAVSLPPAASLTAPSSPTSTPASPNKNPLTN